MAITMSGEATESTEAAPMVAANIDASLVRKLGETQGTYREEEVEESDGGSELSELESSVAGGMEVDQKTGRPNFPRAATRADRRVESTQEFFRRGNRSGLGNGSRDDDNVCATPQLVAMAETLDPRNCVGGGDKKFWWRGNVNSRNPRDGDNGGFATPGRQPMRGALARSLLAAISSSPQQVGTAATLNIAKGAGTGIGGAEE